MEKKKTIRKKTKKREGTSRKSKDKKSKSKKEKSYKSVNHKHSSQHNEPKHKVPKLTKLSNRVMVGLVEPVIIEEKKDGKTRRKLARIDTGATVSSIDNKLAKQLGYKPLKKMTTIKSANSVMKRKSTFIKLKLAGLEFKARFTLSERSHMKFQVLIGRNILKKGFLIDPLKDK